MMNPEVNVYFDQLKQWKPELTVLRKLLLESELKEEFKWSTLLYRSGKKYRFVGNNQGVLHFKLCKRGAAN